MSHATGSIQLLADWAETDSEKKPKVSSQVFKNILNILNVMFFA